MNRTMLLLLGLSSLTACATAHQRNQQALDSWINQSESSLIQVWGVPDKHMSLDGLTYLEYDKCGGGYSQYVGNGLSVNNNYCNVWKFTVRDGKVIQDSLNQ